MNLLMLTGCKQEVKKVVCLPINLSSLNIFIPIIFNVSLFVTKNPLFLIIIPEILISVIKYPIYFIVSPLADLTISQSGLVCSFTPYNFSKNHNGTIDT